MKRPTAVLFDMDGTTVTHVNPRVLRLLERLDDAAHHTARVFSWRRKRGSAGSVPQSLPVNGHPGLLVHRAIHRLRRKAIDEVVQPSPGIFELLELLRMHGVPLGLVSNGMGRGYGHEVLRTFGLERYFDVTVFREDVRRAKPHPDSLLRALDGMGRKLQPDDVVWYIGDQRKDVVAALAASAALGTRIVPIACGLRAARALVEHGLEGDRGSLSMSDLREAFASTLAPASLGAAT